MTNLVKFAKVGVFHEIIVFLTHKGASNPNKLTKSYHYISLTYYKTLNPYKLLKSYCN